MQQRPHVYAALLRTYSCNIVAQTHLPYVNPISHLLVNIQHLLMLVHPKERLFGVVLVQLCNVCDHAILETTQVSPVHQPQSALETKIIQSCTENKTTDTAARTKASTGTKISTATQPGTSNQSAAEPSAPPPVHVSRVSLYGMG